MQGQAFWGRRVLGDTGDWFPACAGIEVDELESFGYSFDWKMGGDWRGI